MLVGKNHEKTEFLEVKTLTSTRMGHVGQQKPLENDVFENENVDIKEEEHAGEPKPQ